MAPKSSAAKTQRRDERKPRDMAQVSVSLIVISLIWAGTHQVGLAQMGDSFFGIDWGLAVGLLVAGGFLFTSLIVQVDIRQRLDAWVFVALGGIPTAVLGFGIYALGVGEVRVLDKLLGWATPYGLAAVGMLIGFALAAAVRVRPPIPVITSENLSMLSMPE